VSSILIAFLIVLLAPLFLATWRTSLIGLSAQGLLMGWMLYRAKPGLSGELLLSMVDLVVIRGAIVPLALHRILSDRNEPRRHDTVPANMLSWAIIGVLVSLGFRFAAKMLPAGDAFQPQLAVATTALLIGMFVLATQTGVFSQVVGALRIEYAIALFELGGDTPAAPLAVRAGQIGVFLATVLLYARYVDRLGKPEADVPPALREPSL
jgi:hydrogenase-4 membrane subunit HyfE